MQERHSAEGIIVIKLRSSMLHFSYTLLLPHHALHMRTGLYSYETVISTALSWGFILSREKKSEKNSLPAVLPVVV
jgi:hypothetical protein